MRNEWARESVKGERCLIAPSLVCVETTSLTRFDYVDAGNL